MNSLRNLLSIFLLLALSSGCDTRVLSISDDGGDPDGRSEQPTPSADRGVDLPLDDQCELSWHCFTNEDGTEICQSEAVEQEVCGPSEDGREFCWMDVSRGGLPPGGSNWSCHLAFEPSSCEWEQPPTVWRCNGRTSEGLMPGGCGWECAPLPGWPPNRVDCWKRATPEGLPEQITPCYPRLKCTTEPRDCAVCFKGTAVGGTRCERVQLSGHGDEVETCRPGQRRWCSDPQYSDWGQVMCDPGTGRWRTKVGANMEETLDCHPMADGSRPNTACACYHPSFTRTCCERADCLVPDWPPAQICRASSGELCDHCNPQNPECKGPDARCIVTQNMEAFCGQDCMEDATSCPPGFQCEPIKQHGEITMQCVPMDLSCYF